MTNATTSAVAAVELEGKDLPAHCPNPTTTSSPSARIAARPTASSPAPSAATIKPASHRSRPGANMKREKQLNGSAVEVETAFYDALNRADVESLMALWADDEEIVCIH